MYMRTVRATMTLDRYIESNGYTVKKSLGEIRRERKRKIREGSTRALHVVADANQWTRKINL